MKKSPLYTGTGDSGTTSLTDGSRIAKDSVRLEAYGTLDEFSAHLGVVAAHISEDNYTVKNPLCAEIKRQLLSVQNMLFNLGGYLATPVAPGTEPAAWGLSTDNIHEIESWIDTLDEATPKIRSFVLPGGSPLSALTHVARTVCRRAERRIITLATIEYVDPALIRYMNRLSDYLFILARFINHISGIEEILWQK